MAAPGWLPPVLALAVALGGWAGSYAAQLGLKAEASRRAELDVNLLFVPPPQLVKALAAGQENLAADGLWLSFLQYYGDRVVKDRRVHHLAEMLHLITDLDPHFDYAYFLGAWALGDTGDGREAVALMRKAAKHNPSQWNYPYLEGFMHFLFVQDYPAAIEAFERAGRMPGADRFCWTMAARVRQKLGQDQDALGIWRQLEANAQDVHTKRIAQRNIARIEAEMAGKQPRAFRINHDSGEVRDVPAGGAEAGRPSAGRRGGDAP